MADHHTEATRQPPSDTFKIATTTVLVYDGGGGGDPAARHGIHMSLDDAVETYGPWTVAAHLEHQASELRDRARRNAV